jgi:hypothetical protein
LVKVKKANLFKKKAEEIKKIKEIKMKIRNDKK